ncbi:hypothetical protein AHAS_Ahas16G0118500 [Arachis hypogaea]
MESILIRGIRKVKFQNRKPQVPALVHAWQAYGHTGLALQKTWRITTCSNFFSNSLIERTKDDPTCISSKACKMKLTAHFESDYTISRELILYSPLYCQLEYGAINVELFPTLIWRSPPNHLLSDVFLNSCCSIK